MSSASDRAALSISRRQFVVTTAGVSIGSLVLGMGPAAAATPGSAIADLQYNGLTRTLGVKCYGAGWPRGTIRAEWRIYRNSVLWRRDGRVKHSDTSFNYSWLFDCGAGAYLLSLDVWGPYGTYAFDDDALWVR
jgi:hypothetical protein